MVKPEDLDNHQNVKTKFRKNEIPSPKGLGFLVRVIMSIEVDKNQSWQIDSTLLIRKEAMIVHTILQVGWNRPRRVPTRYKSYTL